MWHILQRLIFDQHRSGHSIPQTWIVLSIFLWSVFIHSSCHRSLASKRATGDCQPVLVTVVDATSTSGCHVLLHPEGGFDLLPVSYAEAPVDFYPEGMYQITFSPDSSAIYACTAKAIPVHILTCTPVLTGPPPGTGGIKPPKRPCTEALDPYAIPWMTQIMEQLDPDRVTRFKMTSGMTVYAFKSTKGQYLFDCQGSFVCLDKPELPLCGLSSELGEPQVILVRNY